jgi:hypothetical protein
MTRKSAQKHGESLGRMVGKGKRAASRSADAAQQAAARHSESVGTSAGRATQAGARTARRGAVGLFNFIFAIIFAAAGAYVVILGLLGVVHHPRVLSFGGLGEGLVMWVIVAACGACMLLAAALLVTRAGASKTTWTLCFVAAAVGLIAWIWGGAYTVFGIGMPAGSAGQDIALFAIGVAFLLLALISWRRLRGR